MFRENCGVMDRMLSRMGKGFRDALRLNGGPEQNVMVVLFGPDGKIKDVRKVHNTVTTAGKYGAADQLASTPTLPVAHWMELGTGTGGTTLLNAFIAGSRNACTTYTRTLAVVTYVGDWAAGDGTGAITEAGLFDVVTENTVNMWLYTSFAVINKGASDTLQVSWALTFS